MRVHKSRQVIRQHPHRDSPCRRSGQRIKDTLRRLIENEDVKLDVHPCARSIDRTNHVVERLGVALDNLHLVVSDEGERAQCLVHSNDRGEPVRFGTRVRRQSVRRRVLEEPRVHAPLLLTPVCRQPVPAHKQVRDSAEERNEDDRQNPRDRRRRAPVCRDSNGRDQPKNHVRREKHECEGLPFLERGHRAR